MSFVLSSISGNLISAASAGFAPTNSADVSAIASAYQVVSSTATELYAGTAYLTSVNDAPVSASRAGQAANASMANSAYYDGTGRLISSLPDETTVSSIASSYAESAASGKLDTTAFNSGDFYTTANESGYVDSAYVDSVVFAKLDSSASSSFYTVDNPSGFITLADVPAQVNADWDAVSGAAEILNKPSIPSVVQLVPAATSADADKVLTVDSQGTPAWETPAAPAPEIFTATWGTTKAAKIIAAKNAGNEVRVIYNDRIYRLSWCGNRVVQFPFFRTVPTVVFSLLDAFQPPDAAASVAPVFGFIVVSDESSSSPTWTVDYKQPALQSDLYNYATTGYVVSSVSGKLDTTAFNSSDFYGTGNISGFVDSAYVDSAVSGKMDSSASSSFYTTANESGYIGSAYVDSAVSGKADSSALSSYALSSDVSGVIDTVSANSASWAVSGGDVYVSDFAYNDTAISSIKESSLYDYSAHARITTVAGRVNNKMNSSAVQSAYASASATQATATDVLYILIPDGV